jgi:hypothetical protein
MADLRCPHCNSLNPGDAEKCWNCESPLRPEETSSSESDSFDWLSDLRGGSATGTEDQGAEAEEINLDDESTPDWLKRIRERSQIEQTFDLSEEPAAGDDLPDWLKDLQNEPLGETAAAPSEEDTIPPPAGSFESQDWFQGLSTFSSEKEQPAEDEGIPQWLLEDSEQSQPSASEKPEVDQSLPDWLSEEKTETAGDETAAFQREELPDWLLEETGEIEIKPPTSDETAVFSRDDLPDWLSEQPTESETEGQPADSGEAAAFGGDLPDWLSELPAESETEAQPADSGGAAVFGGELPDWLSEQPAESETEAQPAESGEAAVFGGELPDWLSEQPAESETEAQPADSGEAAVFGSDLPDWLSELPEESEPEAQASFAGEAALPDPDSGVVNDETLEHAVEPTAEEELPAWLFSQEMEETPSESEPITQVFELEPSDTAAQEPEAVTPEAEEDLSVTSFEMEDLPDWLSEENIDIPQTVPTASTPAFIMDEGEELDEPEIEQIHPFSDEEIPAWLTNEDVPESEETESEDLTRTTLPNWVEAMRPVETVALGSATAAHEEARTEKAGPLAGLTGVLPAEGSAVEYGRPPTYSMRLRVTDKQRASAALLETVLEEEDKPRELQRERPGTPQAILRLLVGILLIAVIILSGGLPVAGGAGAGDGPANMISFNQQLDTLPEGGAVLLAVDYDPGYSSELTLAGQGVVERLLSRNNRVVLVSTSLAGPVLGEELIMTANTSGTVLTDRVTNLGFLAGGIISLKEFSLAPQAAARYGMDWVKTGQNAWQHPALEGIQRITDFSLVLVMTDSGDTGRMWIEQVQPDLGDVPMMMITTAQAAPILSPYLAGGQIEGLISGLAGGRAYGSSRPATEIEEAWNAYRAGILVTVALILLGVLFRGISSLIPGAKP